MTGGLIAIDWGTSALRAFRLDADGAVVARRERPWGILHLPPDGFAGALAAITADWPAALPALAAGMVGSRGGWREAPYCRAPATVDVLAGSLLPVPDAPRSLLLVPGLLVDDGDDRPDVMRGEETQAIGASARLGVGDALLVMPGTHAKWATLRDGAITRFRTFMTGELHATLLRHSILGRLLPDAVAPPPAPADADAAFRDGVGRGWADGATALLFSVRARPLTGRLDPALIGDYLSGLLLGDELRAGFAAVGADDVPVAIIGDGALARRTADAFAHVGRAAPPILADTAVDGLRAIGRSASLLG